MARPFITARTRLLVRCCVVVVLTGMVALHASTRGAQTGDEPMPHLTATMLLTPEIAQGPHHRVAEDVRTEGYFHEFVISSTFGSFAAVGRTELAVRVQEIRALAALQDVSKTEVFLAAAGQSIVHIGQSAAAVVTDPAAAAKGVGAGIKRFGVNLGRRTQRAVASSGDTAPVEGSAAGGAARNFLGVSAGMRRWARKVGVDPYTTNAVLRKALEDIAKVDAAGSIATKVAVPVPRVIGMTSRVGELVWGQDPEELRKTNEQRLREMSVPNSVSEALFGNQWFTLTYQTRLIAALRAVNVSGVADYVRTATEATSEREALFFVESAEMLQLQHGRESVSAILPDSRALVAVADGRARALLPLDWVSWTGPTQAALRELTARLRQEFRATRLEIVTTGRVTERAMGEIAKLGWNVVPQASGQTAK